MSEDFVNIEINGVALKARKGEVIIRTADREGIYIPRFCFHDKLPIAANCRMCLVEVEKSPKPLPACATPVTEGMKVQTRSRRAVDAQRAVMEFLLINHPLDCPICDQGGECELQDLALGYGRDVSRFVERKRVIKDKNLGPLVSTDMTRCIYCTRCIRFGADIAGFQELGTIGRGELTEVSTCVERSVEHELSGNIIDLCPVGALNSKPFRYTARGWEMTEYPLVSPHDGFGTQIYAHVLRGRLMRVVPRECESLNETWIADRDRFSYEGLYSEDRLLVPQLRGPDGSWREVDWEQALQAAASGLGQAAGQQGGVGLLAHPSSTLEELYLFSRLAEALGSASIDHRLRQLDFSDQRHDLAAPGLGLPIAQVDALDALLVVGSNLRRELPMLAHRVRKAALRGARVSFLNPARFDYLFRLSQYLIASPAQAPAKLAALLAAALEGADASVRTAAVGVLEAAGDRGPALSRLLSTADVTAEHRDVASALRSGARRAIWLGALACGSPWYGELRALARALAQSTGAVLGELAPGGNGAGAYLAGVLPHRAAGARHRPVCGRNARQMLELPLPGYLLLNTEPWADAARPAALETLQRSGFVVSIGPYASKAMREVAHVLLPAAGFAETAGTFVNLEGRWQSYAGAARALGASRPGWKILRVLGNLLELPGCEYQSSEQLRDELQGLLAAGDGAAQEPPGAARDTADGTPQGPQAAAGADSSGAAGAAVIDLPMYQIDPVLRRAGSLLRTHEGRAVPSFYDGQEP